MTNKELEELYAISEKKVLEKLKTNPDELFDLIKLQNKYNQALAKILELKVENKRLKGNIEKTLEVCNNESMIDEVHELINGYYEIKAILQ